MERIQAVPRTMDCVYKSGVKIRLWPQPLLVLLLTPFVEHEFINGAYILYELVFLVILLLVGERNF